MLLFAGWLCPDYRLLTSGMNFPSHWWLWGKISLASVSSHYKASFTGTEIPSTIKLLNYWINILHPIVLTWDLLLISLSFGKNNRVRPFKRKGELDFLNYSFLVLSIEDWSLSHFYCFLSFNKRWHSFGGSIIDIEGLKFIATSIDMTWWNSSVLNDSLGGQS